MTEIAAVIAVTIALAALWLANQAYNQVSSTFEKFTSHMVKEVREAQNEFLQQTKRIHESFRATNQSVDSIKIREREYAERLNTLTQRITVLEHELNSLKSSIPPQYLQHKKRNERSA